ncbi:MAG: hypothetical protein QM820_44965 [Minicystis sp.]
MTTRQTGAIPADDAKQELSPSRLAFLLADIAAARNRNFEEITWTDLGTAADEIKKVIADHNISLDDPEVSALVYAIRYDESSVALVDVGYTGGGVAPDLFRFVYLVSDGKYIGYAGEVAD